MHHKKQALSPNRNQKARSAHAESLAAVRAVGFDLDHTLAIYDDAIVNGYAVSETLSLLAGSGYPRSILRIDYDPAAIARGLHLDLRHAMLVKLDQNENPIRARRRGSWITDDPLPPISGPSHRHALHSVFDLPTGFLFDAILAATAASKQNPEDLCAHIRTTLDRAHRRGILKDRILAELPAVVPRDDLLPGALSQLRARGLRLFVVTNSERTYAHTLLDHILGPWTDLFDVVATDAGKPAFFGASARDLERRLGVAPHEILFVGDHLEHDSIPAKARGWRTAHVAPEMGAGVPGGWGALMDDNGRVTWYSRSVGATADHLCVSVAAVAALWS